MTNTPSSSLGRGLWRCFRAAWQACRLVMRERLPRSPRAICVMYTIHIPVAGKNTLKVYRYRISMN